MANNDDYLLLEHFKMSSKVDKDRRMVAAEIKKGEDFLLIEGNKNIDNSKNKPKEKKVKNKKPFEKKPKRHKQLERA